MSRNDADVPGIELHKLDLARSPARKSEESLAQATQAEWIVRSLKLCYLFRWRRECVHVDAVEQYHDYMRG